MPIVKKTKQEREASQKRTDTPLGETPDPTKPVTDLKSALADINARSAARQKSLNESQEKLDAARIERSRARKSVAGEGTALYGLESFKSTRSQIK